MKPGMFESVKELIWMAFCLFLTFILVATVAHSIYLMALALAKTL